MNTSILALRHCCREATLRLPSDLDVPIWRLLGSREEYSEADAIPEAPFEAPRSRIAAGEKVKSPDTSLAVVRW